MVVCYLAYLFRPSMKVFNEFMCSYYSKGIRFYSIRCRLFFVFWLFAES